MILGTKDSGTMDGRIEVRGISQVYGSCRLEFDPHENVCNEREPKIMEFNGRSWEQAQVYELEQRPHAHLLTFFHYFSNK
jgi:hypothetical protein